MSWSVAWRSAVCLLASVPAAFVWLAVAESGYRDMMDYAEVASGATVMALWFFLPVCTGAAFAVWDGLFPELTK